MTLTVIFNRRHQAVSVHVPGRCGLLGAGRINRTLVLDVGDRTWTRTLRP